MTPSFVATANGIPFDSNKLDRLLEAAGIDLLIASSKHNVQYLLGGYRFDFFSYMDAIGISRYLPIFVYQKGRPETAAYFGSPMEKYERELGKIWTDKVDFSSHGTLDAVATAVAYIQSLGANPKVVAVERAFLPADAEQALRQGLGSAKIVDANRPLERLRAVKTPKELELLREASERVEASMVATFAASRPGMSKEQIVKMLRLNQVQRDLVYEYTIITAGTNLHRNPSPQLLGPHDKMTLDSGGNYGGYIGDICRVGVFGTPDQELVDLLAEVDNVQQAARRAVKAGARGGDVVEAGYAALRASPHRSNMFHIAHGMGMVAHEAPQLADENPHKYPAVDKELPLEAGMVISVETGMEHPTRGYVKLEDTLAVTTAGYQAFGDRARGWNPMGC